jgi:hypothetical protein
LEKIMTVKYVTRLTTTSSEVYPTLEAWVAAHGNAGTKRPLLLGAKLVLEADGRSVLRTLEFASEADYASTREEIHAENSATGTPAAGRLYTVEKIEKI